MDKPNNVIRIPCSLLDSSFFKYWFVILKPFHHLTNREIEVITCFVKHRYELSKSITDSKLLDQVTMSEETKRKVREECHITHPYFQVIMGNLRKNKVIKDGVINSRFIPNIVEEDGYFKLLFLFDFKNDKQ